MCAILTPLSGKFDVVESLEEPYHADAEPKDIKGGLFLALFSTVDSNETCQSLLCNNVSYIHFPG